MTQEEHERLFALITNPPPGGEIEAAKKFGIDLTLNLRRLTLSPAERVEEMERARRFMEDLRQAAEQLGR